jgi:hypothetical protein
MNTFSGYEPKMRVKYKGAGVCLYGALWREDLVDILASSEQLDLWAPLHHELCCPCAPLHHQLCCPCCCTLHN